MNAGVGIGNATRSLAMHDLSKKKKEFGHAQLDIELSLACNCIFACLASV